MRISYKKRIGEDNVKAKGLLYDSPLSALPLGEIKCVDGWLANQLSLVAEGITGRLPEYGPFFKKEANGFLYPESRNGWEEVPLWLRGFYPLAVLKGDAGLLDTAQEYIDAILRSADEDGWFGPVHLKEFEVTKDGKPIPDLFPNMLLTDTLILYYSHTGDEKIVKLLGKYFAFCASLSDEQLIPAIDTHLRWQAIRAGDMLEQLYWYYRQTKDESVLKLATRVYRKIIKSTAGYTSVHAVDFAQRFAYDGIYSQQSYLEDDFLRTEFEYDKFASVWGQMPRGIFAVDEQIRIGAIDPRQGFEPCGIVELAKNFYVLGRISGLCKFADRTEDIMLNHFTASFTSDYKQIHYVTASNQPILTNYVYAASYNGSECHDRSYQIFTPNNRCCGHNTGMGWPWYAMNLWQKTEDGGLAAFLYAPCTVNTVVSDQKVSLKVDTDYPFKDTININILSDGKFPLYLRVPSWCEKTELWFNGEKIYTDEKKDGWLLLDSEWKAGDKIRLRLAMTVSLTKWRSNGSVSVDLGPLSYSVRIKEKYTVVEDALAYNHPEPHLWENYEVTPESPWNYGLLLDEGVAESIHIKKCADVLPKQPFEEASAPVILKARAKRIPQWKIQDSCAAELQRGPFYTETQEEEIELIPLGCARLRISCFPVITRNEAAARWKEVPEHIPLEKRPQFFNFQYDFDEYGSTSCGPWDPEKI